MIKEEIIYSDLLELKKNNSNGCYYHILKADKINTYALVFTLYDSGYEEGEVIIGKIAYQPNNSLLQCDYEFDWLMPELKSGMIFDTEIMIKRWEHVAWLFEQWERYLKIRRSE